MGGIVKRSMFCDHLLLQPNFALFNVAITEQANPLWYGNMPLAINFIIDFAGRLYLTSIGKQGEISVQVFVACLPYSDYGFCMGAPSKRQNDFIMPQCCLKDIGRGTPNLGS